MTVRLGLNVSVGFLLALIHTFEIIVSAAITATMSIVGNMIVVSMGAWKASQALACPGGHSVAAW